MLLSMGEKVRLYPNDSYNLQKTHFHLTANDIVTHFANLLLKCYKRFRHFIDSSKRKYQKGENIVHGASCNCFLFYIYDII